MTTRKQALVWTATVAVGTALLGLGTIAVAAHLETADHIAGVIGALAALVALGPVAHRLIARRAAGTPGPAAVAADAGDADPVVDAPEGAPSGASISRNSIQGSMVVNGNVDIRHQPPALRSHHVVLAVAGVVITVVVVSQLGGLSLWPTTEAPPAADRPAGASSGTSSGPDGRRGGMSPRPGATAAPLLGSTMAPLSGVTTAPPARDRPVAERETPRPAAGDAGAATTRPTRAASRPIRTTTRTPAPAAGPTAAGPVYSMALGSDYERIYVTREDGIERGEPGDFQVHPDEAAPRRSGAVIALLGSASSCDEVELATQGVEFDAGSGPVVVCGRTHAGLPVRLTFSPHSDPGDGPHQLVTVSFAG